MKINIKDTVKYFAIILLLAGSTNIYTRMEDPFLTRKKNSVKIVDPSLTREENKVINLLEELISSSKSNGKTLQQYIEEIVTTIKSNPLLIKQKPQYQIACDVLSEVNNTALKGLVNIDICEAGNIQKNKIDPILKKYKIEKLENAFPNNIIKYLRNKLIQSKLLISTKGKDKLNKGKALRLIRQRLKGK